MTTTSTTKGTAIDATTFIKNIDPSDLARMQWAWRVVRPDFTSSRGYRWPFPGSWASTNEADINPHNGGACPSSQGDGICLAKDWRGAASGSIPASSILVCGYLPEDVLGDSTEKLRVRRAFVLDLVSAEALLHSAVSANLSYANLSSADLRYANLRYANLSSADLSYANLRSANLSYANLRYADLSYADLSACYGNEYTALPHGYELRNGLIVPKSVAA